MSLEELEITFERCKTGNRLSQKQLYQQFYGLAMSVCLRYAHSREEAEEMCHDGFMKVFTKINDCAGAGSLVGWMRQIFLRSAIDYYRRHRKYQESTVEMSPEMDPPTSGNIALDSISVEEKLKLVQQLPTTCRITFNLYVVEGFSTAEIADSLQTAEGTVRANLSKARIRLQHLIAAAEKLPPATAATPLTNSLQFKKI